MSIEELVDALMQATAMQAAYPTAVHFVERETARAALLAAMGQGQPAAHRQKSGDGYFYIECDPLDVHDNGRPWEPLFTGPQASEWVKVSERLPDLGAPVWLALENGSIIIGCRVDEGDGWLWGQCFSMPWINAKGVWECDAEMDDHYEVTHWRELPAPLPIEVTG